MARGPKKGTKQSKEHIEKRFADTTNRKRRPAHNRMSNSDFLNKLLTKWPNIPYGLSKIQYVPKQKIELICEKHGSFFKWPSDVLNHSGCSKCVNQGFDKEYHMDTLKNMWPDYNFSKYTYTNAKNKSVVICKKHGDFLSNPNSLKTGHGCPKCGLDVIMEKRILSGRAKPITSLSEYLIYKRQVWKESNKNYRKFKDLYGDRNSLYHLDHIFSILDGFNNKIDPTIIGSAINLRIISGLSNRSKNSKSHISKQELFKLFEDSKNYGEIVVLRTRTV